MASQSLFIEGPAGVGKTTYAIQYAADLLNQGINPESILVLVPHPALGRAYQLSFMAPDWPGGAQIDVVTLGGLAKRGLETFWPLIAEKAGFGYPQREPTFLSIETAQYYMARFVQAAIKTGIFDSINITPHRIMSQTLDNLSKAAVNRYTLDEVADLLITAWGDRHSSRPPVYRASVELAQEFREHCLKNNLLDFSLQIELFIEVLLKEPLYQEYFAERCHHLIADNLEESIPVAADFVSSIWDDLESALLLFDTDGGYRIFLGANPGHTYQLKDLCAESVEWQDVVSTPPVMVALANEFDALISKQPLNGIDINPRGGFTFASCKFYPQMIDWVVDQITRLIEHGVEPGEIVVLAPFLGDSLRFALTTRLSERGIATVSHRPSRAVRDEPAARAMLTLAAVAHHDWGYHPPVPDVADALQQVIGGLDPVRAWLLAQIVYRPHHESLGSFDLIEPGTQERITYRVGERYEHLRTWLLEYNNEAGGTPPDHFLSRLFGEVLSQPGYGFHTNLDAGRVVAELVQSAQKFRQTLYPDGVEDWLDISREYFSLVQDGLLAALYMSSWRDEDQNAVFLAPAYTYLMRNRWADHQFWLDVGSNFWWERLEQPLTHPYVLSRTYPAGQIWSDDLEFGARQDALRRLMLGLVRRCRKHIYVAVSDLGEQGYEQRGPLLRIFQQIMKQHEAVEGDQ